RRADGHDLELDEVAPLQDPRLERRHIVALHQLEAAVEVGLHPALDVAQALGQRAAPLADAGVDRRRVAVLEALDDEEQHRGPPPGSGESCKTAPPSQQNYGLSGNGQPYSGSLRGTAST